MRSPNRAEGELKASVMRVLESDRLRLLMKQPFFGSMLMRLEMVPCVDSRLHGQATNDGNSLFVDARTYAGKTGDERLAVLAHEVWHIAMLHAFRRLGRPSKHRWWTAAHLESHFILREAGFKDLSPPPFKPSWRGRSAEELYEVVPEKEPGDPIDTLNPEELPAPGQAPSSNRQMSSSPQPRGGAKEKRCPSASSQQNSMSGEGLHLEPNTPLPTPRDAPGHECVVDPDFAPSFAKDQKERCRENILCALQMVERTRGEIPGYLKRLLHDLLLPKLDWRELLAQFIATTYQGKRQWLPPNRRHVWQGLYMPSQRSECIEGVVAIDTSGSMADELQAVFSEVHGLLRTFGRFNLTLIQCDADIQSVHTISDECTIPPKAFEAHGLGGTDFRPVFEQIDNMPEPPNFLVYLTDGCGPAPDQPPPYPVLWILPNTCQPPAHWGYEAHLERNTRHDQT
jgi:predicted metal-dependent peptidase